MKFYTRVILIVLCLLMLIGAVACDGKTTDGGRRETEDTSKEAEEYASTLTGVQRMMYERSLIKDQVGDIDFRGETFGMVVGEGNGPSWRPEELTADQLEAALYNMNEYTENRLNVKILYEDKGADPAELVAMGDDTYSVVSAPYNHIGWLATDGYLLDWETMPYMDLDAEWYNQTARKAVNVKGRSFMIVGAVNVNEVKCTYCVYFNKKLTDEYASVVPNLYDLVYDGKWTMDEFIRLSRIGYIDMNGNQRADKNDQFGLVAQTSSYAVPYLYSCGEMTTSRDENDVPYIDVHTEKVTSIVEKVYELIYGDPTSVLPTFDWSTHNEIFVDGRAMFMYSQFWACLTSFKEMQDRFGILPYPKYDEMQKDYYTCTDPSGSTLGLLLSCKNRELTGAVLEVMNWKAWQSVTPALYESALKGRAADEENDANMLDIINKGVVYDFGYIYGGPGELLSKMMTHRTKNFASEYRSRIKNWEYNISSAVEAILSNDR